MFANIYESFGADNQTCNLCSLYMTSNAALYYIKIAIRVFLFYIMKENDTIYLIRVKNSQDVLRSEPICTTNLRRWNLSWF